MRLGVQLHPLQVKGKYYVDVVSCYCTTSCQYEAPEHFAIDEDAWTAYVYRQPETPEEEAACRRAMACCPHEAIHDDGEL